MTICQGCGQSVSDDDSIIQTPPPAQVVWHARCHDRCAKAMKRKKIKIRPWRAGEREALERSGFIVAGLSEGAKVERDDAEDLARTMPEAFGR